MPYHITLDEEEDLKWLRRVIGNAVIKAKGNPSAYCDIAPIVERIDTALQHPEISKSDNHVVPEPKPKKSASPAPKVLAKLCPDHPTYAARRSPRTPCEGCWTAYEKMNPTRGKIQRRKFFGASK